MSSGFEFDDLDDRPDEDEKNPYMPEQLAEKERAQEERFRQMEIADRAVCDCQGACKCSDASCSTRLCQVSPKCRLGRYPRVLGIPNPFAAPLRDCGEPLSGGRGLPRPIWRRPPFVVPREQAMHQCRNFVGSRAGGSATKRMAVSAAVRRMTIGGVAVRRTSGGGGDDASFDDLVYTAKPIGMQAQLGFGGARLLEIVESPQVRPTYSALRSMADRFGGHIRVSVQVLPSPARQSHLRYVFQFWKREGFIHSKLAASFHVDERRDYRMADGHATTLYASPITTHDQF